jgi:hypothetical protein
MGGCDILTEQLVMPENEKRHVFRDETGHLLEAIIVIYSGVYQRKTSLDRIRTIELEVFEDACLHDAYQRIWQTLPDFCKWQYADNIQRWY